MTRSLRQRFVWVLGVSSMLAWSLLALWQAAQIGTQVDALFEAHIAEGAKILEALVRSESLEYPPGTGPSPIARIPGRDPTAAGGVEDRAFRDG